MFQTLLSWKSVSGDVEMAFVSTPNMVSNLVVMEVGQRQEEQATSFRRDSSFNLVVMEVGQRHLGSWRTATGQESFKPCCHGSRSAARDGDELTWRWLKFQTLLSWKSVSGIMILDLLE